MKGWKKGVLAAAVCAALLFGLMAPAFGTTGNINLMAVNDTVVEMTVENMPRTVSGVLYVPYTMLSNQANGFSLGVSALYSTTRRTVLVTDNQKGIIFDLQNNTAQDLDGNSISVRAMVRNSTVFLPIDWLCQYFGSISCTRTWTPYGTLIRVTNSAAILSDQDFADAAGLQLSENLRRYLDAGGRGEGLEPLPSGGVDSSEPPSGAELYLALSAGMAAAECAQLLESRNQRALFLFEWNGLAEEDDLVRRVVGAGHTVGLVLDGDSLEGCLAQAERGRELVAAAARYNALVMSAPNLDDEGREALKKEGYVVWSTTVAGKDFSTGTALVRGLDVLQTNYVEIDCGAEGAAFLRTALTSMEEENCQIYQATAPALA